MLTAPVPDWLPKLLSISTLSAVDCCVVREMSVFSGPACILTPLSLVRAALVDIMGTRESLCRTLCMLVDDEESESESNNGENLLLTGTVALIGIVLEVLDLLMDSA